MPVSGQIAFDRGESRHAIELLEDALRIAGRQPEDHPAVADTLAYAAVGDHAPAIRIFRQALRAAEERDDGIEGTRFGVLLANAYIDDAAFSAAEQVLHRTVERAPDRADPIFRAKIYCSQSRLHALREDAVTAARCARKALELLELTEHTHYAARAHQLLAHVELDRGNGDEALALIERALPLVESTGNTLDVALFRLEKARALVQLGRKDEAEARGRERGDPRRARVERRGPSAGVGRGDLRVARRYREGARSLRTGDRPARRRAESLPDRDLPQARRVARGRGPSRSRAERSATQRRDRADAPRLRPE